MEKYELPLVIFTVLSQLSVGMTLSLTYSQWRGKALIKRHIWLINIVVFSVSGLAALFHLAHPLHAYRALFNLSNAWLSREILCAMIYGGTLAFCFIWYNVRVASLIASLCGFILIFVQGMTYAATAMVAIANGFTMILFFLSVWVLGAAVAPLHGFDRHVNILRQGMVAVIVLLFAVPAVWRSGNAMMQQTADNWLTSPLFALSIVSMLSGILMSYRYPRAYKLIFSLIVISLISGRLVFFGETVSTINNIGSLY
ncbi:dimethyl sulfoxide reductase anchor subunit family protein [Escherichia coli]|uniref:dimethyl sulfoxide reductase anchor subunit family protein n=1 Tax=Escherichia coli TaxID=562 RepID=UPI000750D4EE|nr:DmsC/YnfH family molybdoenzyme membrane anchor subunit [Escherichia coli]EGA7217664.1 dimethyl sulfoxide reductase anchor subunit [Shigella sonnei]EAC1376946.1 hydrogenase [Escherichia coli]EEQ2125516.1 dimethyl sulfoxide reductase anchor subunit [Escherichia coli]EEQ3744664.1 dimethyl sulfoxide reductase anchor subunit [Escherichia coli]EES1795097.1 dimethyl sulfoxide reductase anchor subunit [Escherichia coli]